MERFLKNQRVRLVSGERLSSGAKQSNVTHVLDSDEYLLEHHGDRVHHSLLQVVPFEQYISKSMQDHNDMYEKAETNKFKGVEGGDCNVTQCQKAGATMYNKGTRAWYCEECSTAINDSCRYSDFWPLCISKDQKVKESQEALKVEEEGHRRIQRLRSELDVGLLGTVKTSPYIRSADKVGRNDPCPCGSGDKNKKCCKIT